MSKTSKTIRKMCALAGISILAASASAAMPFDTRIMIDRALNSPTLTVRYTGANAALVELRVNGESLGTRAVTASKANGETNFDLNLSDLKDGDNEVEIRLFDRTGKLVGSDKTNISTDQSTAGPVFLRTPKVGQTVMGPVDIEMGFGRDMKNVFVSFFVDNNFKRMTNYPPFTMTWDTTGESNGWHEIEAWAIDETSSTYKTRKTRVFVNNPQGATARVGVPQGAAPTKNAIKADVTGAEVTGLRPVTSGSRAVRGANVGVIPTVSTSNVVPNKIGASATAAMSNIKAAPVATAQAMGPRAMVPTATKVAATTPIVASTTVPSGYIKITQSGAGAALNSVNSASSMVRITKGQRVPNLATFAVVLNSQFVNFDVPPRVDNGIPMTPFRHLLEKAGGSVDWKNVTKTVSAKSEGHNITIQIGDRNATINDLKVSLEVAPYIDRGRTIVPLSFIHDALNVDVEFDKETGHVLITTAK